MVEKSLIENLWRLWKAYVDFSVIGNNELKRAMFHVFLGTVLTEKKYSYIEGAKRKSLRIHTFIIQDSGTGKSQIMKALHEIIAYLGIQSRITVKDNEASLTGTVYKDIVDNKIHVRKGMLYELKLLCWDEGSVLLKHSGFMDVLTDYFQNVMDEPGKISKGMKLGKVEYFCNCTLIAGSYMFDAFRETLLTKGFLQRMYISFKEFNEKEKRDIRIGVNLLKSKKNFAQYDELKAAIAKIVKKIPKLKGEAITFNNNDLMKFQYELESIYQNYIVGAFIGEKQKILETFYSRLHLLIDKIAAQHAIIEGRKEVVYEDLVYGRKECEMHIQSLLKIFDYLSSGKIITTGDERQLVIINTLKQNQGQMIKSALLDTLKERKNIGRWDLGFNRTLSLINDMIAARKIHVEKTGKNVHLLILPGVLKEKYSKK